MCHVNERFNAEDWDRVISSMKEEKESEDKYNEEYMKRLLEIIEFAKQQVNW